MKVGGLVTVPATGVLDSIRGALLAEATNALRYRCFRTTAEIEGNSVVAELFGELAESSEMAAAGHLDALMDHGDPVTGRPMGVTNLNLAAALAGELREMHEVYPDLAAGAIQEDAHDLASWASTLAALKTAHVRRLREALATATTTAGEPGASDVEEVVSGGGR